MYDETIKSDGQMFRIRDELFEKYKDEMPYYRGESINAKKSEVDFEIKSDIENASAQSVSYSELREKPASGGILSSLGSLGGSITGFLSDISIEDIILLGIGLLILLDDDKTNDILMLLILAFVFF